MKSFVKNLSLFIIIVCIAACEQSQQRKNVSVTPPVAGIIPRADTLHGDIRIDDYYWMREKTNPELIAYLNAENRYTDAMMEHTEKFQKKLYDELLGRIKETDMSVPVKIDNYF